VLAYQERKVCADFYLGSHIYSTFTYDQTRDPLTNALEELNVLITNAAKFCNHKSAIDIADNHKIVENIDITYQLVCENIEFRQISLLQIELVNNLANIGTNGLLQVMIRTLRNASMVRN
jgi:hypothetical protein